MKSADGAQILRVEPSAGPSEGERVTDRLGAGTPTVSFAVLLLLLTVAVVVGIRALLGLTPGGHGRSWPSPGSVVNTWPSTRR